MLFAATRMNLEIVIPSEVRQRQISYDITYMWYPIKNDTNELIYKTETNKEQICGCRGGGLGEGEGSIGSLGLSNYYI